MSHSNSNNSTTSSIPVDPNVSIRAIITTKEAGVIIGREGKNVTKIREESGAKVTVSEHVPGTLDRIITVAGDIDTVSKAFLLVSERIVIEFEKERQLFERERLSLRILIPDTRMGSIIGKGGSKIKEIQEISNAYIIASEEILPNSTERTVIINGTVQAIKLAIYNIGIILRENPDRNLNTIYYKPMPLSFYQNSLSALSYSLPYTPPIIPPNYAASSASYPVPLYINSTPMNGPPPSISPHPIQQIYVPNELIGCVIGKQGDCIKRIRNISGSQIKIAEPNPNITERLITITGNAETNNVAIYMILSRLENERNKLMKQKQQKQQLSPSQSPSSSPAITTSAHHR
ncbi:eukaryotic type KH-domain (KH-domain type I) [Anaeromyces robustus]|uniref:Eukaryotic type KH-domain (KH-domain type I) n=1 Tax=Anaeromyces robustus TaxID=1754192 RepID=A0A1Y1VBS6_9FUNG|nr:eukaryotic type KH-domain (KH-domain type I) [Anaeromyces robustus]|eukprot:ORX51350.1 eukaryotic type KH-domain (KH-domain type I) [Anaeromyces robustus]